MSNKIFYDPYDEIKDDIFALEKLLKESEAKDQQIAIYKRALELASKPRNDWGCTDREYNNYKYDTYYDYYLDQAKKELEEQDVTNN